MMRKGSRAVLFAGIFGAGVGTAGGEALLNAFESQSRKCATQLADHLQVVIAPPTLCEYETFEVSITRNASGDITERTYTLPSRKDFEANIGESDRTLAVRMSAPIVIGILAMAMTMAYQQFNGNEQAEEDIQTDAVSGV